MSTPVPGLLYTLNGGRTLWTAKGRPDLPAGGRDLLVPGAYVPGVDTTGVPAGTVLTDYYPPNGIWNIDTPGIYRNLRVHGSVKARANGVELHTSEVLGRPATANPARGFYLPAVDCVDANAQATPIKLVDCTVRVGTGADLYPVKGKAVTLVRCDLSGGVDIVQTYGTTRIIQSWLHDMKWVANDPNQGPEGSHDDVVQFQGGGDLEIIGSFLDARMPGGPGPGTSWLVCLVTNDAAASQGVMATRHVTVEDSFSRGGTYPWNFAIHPTGTVSFKRNRIGAGSAAGAHVIARSSGAYNLRALIQSEPGNVDWDTGNPITVANGG